MNLTDQIIKSMNSILSKDELNEDKPDNASRIYCGFVVINDFASSYMCRSFPFGGVKNSGFGRFVGVEGLRACCLIKAVAEDR